MASMLSWKRLVRYIAHDQQVRFGEPRLPDGSSDILSLAREGNLVVEVLEGNSVLYAKSTGREESVKELLSPLAAEDVPFIRCIGLNYKTHSK